MKYLLLGILEGAVQEFSTLGFLAFCLCLLVSPFVLLEITVILLINRTEKAIQWAAKRWVLKPLTYLLQLIHVILKAGHEIIKIPRRVIWFLTHITAYATQEAIKWLIKFFTMLVVEAYVGIRKFYFFIKANREAQTRNGDLILLLFAFLTTIYALLKFLPGLKLVSLTLLFFIVILLSRSIIPRYRLDMVIKQTWRVWVFIYIVVIVFWFWTGS